MDCFTTKKPEPKRIPYVVKFGRNDDEFIGDPSLAMNPPQTITDDYFWMRDDQRKDSNVIKHLKHEDRYTKSKTSRIKPLAHQIYKELISDTVQTDCTVPIPLNKYMYYTRTQQRKSYKIHCRKSIGYSSHSEQVILDENKLARGKTYCNIGMTSLSPCENILAYSVDFSGAESYSIRFIHIDSGITLAADTLESTTGFMCWGKSRMQIYYCTMDNSFRSNKVWRHCLKSKLSTNGEITQDVLDVDVPDECLFEEKDPKFSASVWKSRSQRFVFIMSSSSNSSEQRYIDLNAEAAEFSEESIRLIKKRESNVLYEASHSKGDQFLICTNAEKATNFKIMTTLIGEKESSWIDLLPYNALRSVTSIVCFESFSVVSGRDKGLPALWILPQHKVDTIHQVEGFERDADIHFEENLKYETKKFRFVFSSLLTPHQTWEYDTVSHERILLKQVKVPSYERIDFESKRIFAMSKDGTKIPISLVWKKKGRKLTDKPNFLHLYAYGSYQVSMDLSFRKELLPMLKRGIIYAIAHVRGGGEFGREWYETATFEHKTVSFDDFISCAEHLIRTKHTSEQMISIEGRSAGGLVVAAAINKKPHIFRACMATVPFVDVLNTMADASLPLTTGEWLEWGNPHQRKYFEAIKSYCPYQNVHMNPYPAVLATVGLHDNRVLYSEAAKWVAKLRDYTTSQRDVLLKVNMSAGHYSSSSRYFNLKEKAFQLAWVISELGIKWS